ncbi:MAG: MFS transporter [Hyphomicrobiaceae bacterium]
MPSARQQGSAPKPTQPRLLVAGAIGTGLEFYDLTIYGMMAPTLAQLFFPSDNVIASLIASFAAFAVGLVARIVGGAVFGWIADRFHRRVALLASIALMATSCALLAILPTFAVIGLSAPVLLVGLRIAQGLAVGGELGVSYVYIGENVSPDRRALAMSSVGMGPMIGILLGAGVVAILHVILSDEQFQAYGWRIAFGLGVLVALVGFLIRKTIEVGDVGDVRSRSRRVAPSLLAGQGLTLVLNVTALAGIAGCFFALFFFVPHWAVHALGVTASETHVMTLFLALLIIVSLPACGLLADWLGNRNVAVAGAIALAISIYPVFTHLSGVEAFFGLLMISLLAVLLAAYITSIAGLTFNLYEQSMRATNVSLAFNIAYGAVGGTAPMMALWLNSQFANQLAFVWYLTFLCCASAVALVALKPILARR